MVLIFRPLPQRPLFTWRDFPAPSVGAVTREVGTVWLVYPTILPELAKGETDDLGYATKRLVLIFYTLFLPNPYLAWGRGKMGEMGERGEEGWDLLGNSSHPWSGVYGACVGADRSGIPPIKI